MTYKKVFNNYALIFVCHNFNSFCKIRYYLNYENCFVIVVGNDIEFVNKTKEHIKNKIIVAKNYENNIEDEWKLLTFTAWYLIIKNNLFCEYSHLCILEYDVIIQKKKRPLLNLDTLVKQNDVISFFECSDCFLCDVNVDVITSFLKDKNIDASNYLNPNLNWYATTNHCIKRDILAKFVDWYYPDCLYFKTNHYGKFSYYHERLFFVFLLENKYNIYSFKCIKHLFAQSHLNV